MWRNQQKIPHIRRYAVANRYTRNGAPGAPSLRLTPLHAALGRRASQQVLEAGVDPHLGHLAPKTFWKPCFDQAEANGDIKSDRVGMVTSSIVSADQTADLHTLATC